MFPRSSRDVLLDHVMHVKETVVIKNKIDAQNAALLESELERWAKRHKILSRIRIIVFVLLYASAFSVVNVLSDVVQTLASVAQLVGAGILSLVVLYLSYRMREVFNKMLVLYSHVIAIYEKHNKQLYSKDHLP